MQISKNTKLHLNITMYFDEDGYYCQDRQEAINNSLDKEAIAVVKKQNCYLYEYDEFDDSTKEETNSWINSFNSWSDIKLKPNEVMYLMNSNCTWPLIVNTWKYFQELLDNKTLTAVGGE